jgi:hypothetical protein
VAPGESDRCEWEHITRLLAGMYWSAGVSYEGGRLVAVCWLDCGADLRSLCLLPEPTASFEYTDEQFLRACGVRPPDMRDGHFARRGEAL